MERACSLGPKSGSRGRADVERDGWNSAQAPGQCLEIKACPPDKNRQPTIAFGLRERSPRIAEPAPDRIVLRRVDMAVEAVRHPRLILARRPRRDDAKVPVDLHRIGIDHHATEP